MTLVDMLFLAAAGFISGMVNAVAGGGTFLTFGALSLIGAPPIAANATSSIIQFPGYITSTLACWRDIVHFWRGALLLCLISAAGALAGALNLIAMDNPSFQAMVPWLLLAATALFAAGPWLKAVKTQPGATAHLDGSVGGFIQFLTGAYGGFFGAGMGVMMLATLGLTQSGDYHRINALKNMLSIVIALVAVAVFMSGKVIVWSHAFIMMPAAALGGFAGIRASRRVPQNVMRAIVITVGLLLAVFYFFKG